MDALHDALLTASADQLLVIDVDGLVLAVNAAMCDRLGIAREDLLGTDLFALFPPEIAERRRRQVRQAVSLRAPVSFVDVSAGGTEFEAVLVPAAAENGAVSSVVIRARTITPSERVEEERTRLALAIEQAVEAIILLGEDLTVQYVNQAFEEMTGFALQEIRGKSLEILYQGADQKRVIEIIRETLDSRDSWMGRTTATRKDGTILVCEKTLARIRGKRFKALGYVSVWRDITDLVQLERQLRHAQKMEAIATLAGGIAHDFNNILGVIMGYAEIVLTGAAKDPGLERRVREILAAGSRARDLVNQILNFSRQAPQERHSLKLAPLIKEALKLLRSSLPANIAMRTDLRTEDDLVLADPTQVHQILLNLCGNAAHAMRESGGGLDVVLTGASEPGGPPLPAGLGDGRFYLRLTVRDTGHGMPPDVQERIFDPFFTTKKPGEGTGMGLAVVHGIVKRHDGAVTVESEPGKGTAFHVFLPRAQALERPVEAAEPVLLPTKGRILFVDDEKPLVDIGREMLEGFGFEVVARTSSVEALEAFRHRSRDFDLVLSDQSMPNMTGVELAREILRIREDIPIVLCTGFSEGLSLERLRSMGIADCIMKPLLKRQLVECVGRLLRRGGGEPKAAKAGKAGKGGGKKPSGRSRRAPRNT